MFFQVATVLLVLYSAEVFGTNIRQRRHAGHSGSEYVSSLTNQGQKEYANQQQLPQQISNPLANQNNLIRENGRPFNFQNRLPYGLGRSPAGKFSQGKFQGLNQLPPFSGSAQSLNPAGLTTHVTSFSSNLGPQFQQLPTNLAKQKESDFFTQYQNGQGYQHFSGAQVQPQQLTAHLTQQRENNLDFSTYQDGIDTQNIFGRQPQFQQQHQQQFQHQFQHQLIPLAQQNENNLYPDKYHQYGTGSQFYSERQPLLQQGQNFHQYQYPTNFYGEEEQIKAQLNSKLNNKTPYYQQLQQDAVLSNHQINSANENLTSQQAQALTSSKLGKFKGGKNNAKSSDSSSSEESGESKRNKNRKN